MILRWSATAFFWNCLKYKKMHQCWAGVGGINLNLFIIDLIAFPFLGQIGHALQIGHDLQKGHALQVAGKISTFDCDSSNFSPSSSRCPCHKGVFHIWVIVFQISFEPFLPVVQGGQQATRPYSKFDFLPLPHFLLLLRPVKISCSYYGLWSGHSSSFGFYPVWGAGRVVSNQSIQVVEVRVFLYLCLN